MERNKSMKWNGIDFIGLYTVIYHQYFQMVNILILHYRQLYITIYTAVPGKYEQNR